MTSTWKPTPGRDAMTRDGRRATEIERRNTVSPYVISGRIGITYYTWMEDGHHSAVKVRHPLDLVADADPLPATGPVRERTVREIVEGVYGRLRIVRYAADEGLSARFVARNGAEIGGADVVLTAREVDKVIATLTAIRDAMEVGE